MGTGGEHFGTVDSAYLKLLAESLRRDKQRTYELMRVGAGQRGLDVGCGTGEDTIALAGLVGPNGRVTGVETAILEIATA